MVSKVKGAVQVAVDFYIRWI